VPIFKAVRPPALLVLLLFLLAMMVLPALLAVFWGWRAVRRPQDQ
jgi:hypothetical protein